MDRSDAITTLSDRQKFINESSTGRARAALHPYLTGREGPSALTDAVVNLLADVAHLAEDEGTTLHLGELEDAVRWLFGAERLREVEEHLETTVPEEGYGSFPAVPE